MSFFSLGPSTSSGEDSDRLIQLQNAMAVMLNGFDSKKYSIVEFQNLFEYRFSGESGLHLRTKLSPIYCRVAPYGLLAIGFVPFVLLSWQRFGLGRGPEGSLWDWGAAAAFNAILIYFLLQQPKHAPVSFQIAPNVLKANDQAGHTHAYQWVDLRQVSILSGMLTFSDGRHLRLRFSAFQAFDETMWDCMVRIAGDSAPALKREWALWKSIPEFHSLHNWLLLAWVIASVTFLLAVLSLPLFGPEYDVKIGAAPFVVIFGGGAVLFLQKRLRFMGIKLKLRIIQGAAGA